MKGGGVVAKKTEKKSGEQTTKGPKSLFEQKYRNECIPGLMKKFAYANPMQVPRITKVVVNTTLKDAISDFKILEAAAQELGQITGQRPVYTMAKKSISTFKLRKGMKIGACVTLRGLKMYEFLNRLFNVALPRVRDFKGVSNKAFDGRGNYTLGLSEQIIFPEINYDKVQKVMGMNVTIVTTAKKNEEAHALLQALGMPFKR
ncbi:MAG: 50S ribosomal protein L5 [Deltaproteobacteria bacterium]|nr:50S ribosomal protein L5 [Deltaproteobacteria bacterium]